MKIGFCGTHGTGKTTKAYKLAYELKLKGKDVRVLTASARSCPLPINQRATFKSQVWIMFKIVMKEIESNAEVTITDRTVLDAYAYTKSLFPKKADVFKPFVLEWLKTYDKIIWARNLDHLAEDGVRPSDKTFQENIDSIIEHFVDEENLKVIQDTL